MRRYVISHGKRIAVETISVAAATIKPRRKPFKTQFVKVPARWIKALSQTKSAGTWRLAMVILAESFKCKHLGGEIVLSSRVTQMSSATRHRAARELANLGLIQLEIPNGKRAPKVLAVRELIVVHGDQDGRGWPTGWSRMTNRMVADDQQDGRG
jgi:hypothetical protein